MLFEPIERPGFGSHFEVFPFINNDTGYLIAYYNHIGSRDNYPELMIINGKGEIIKNYKFPKSDKKDRILLLNETNKKEPFNIVNTYGKIISFNKELKITGINSLNRKIKPHIFSTDLNNDGKPEFFLTTYNGELMIVSNDFSHPVLLSFDSPMGHLSIIDNGLNNKQFYIHNDKSNFIFQYQFNPLYYLRFPVYLSIFCILWLFVLLIRKLQLIQLERKNQVRNQILELQLKTFKNQINPHFAFNVFNTIASIIRNESKMAYKPFIQFSNLIRNTLESSDKITLSIEDELNYLENYLELEKLRFPDKLTYSIKISENVDTELKIPKMILQTYVENAIKHGIRHKDGKGLVEVNISKTKDFIKIEITDNGVGRKKAKELSADSTGFGLKIMDNYFKLFNEYNESKIKHEIVDLYEKNNIPSGTKVKILIPLNFSYKLRKHGK